MDSARQTYSERFGQWEVDKGVYENSIADMHSRSQTLENELKVMSERHQAMEGRVVVAEDRESAGTSELHRRMKMQLDAESLATKAVNEQKRGAAREASGERERDGVIRHYKEVIELERRRSEEVEKELKSK